METRIPHKSFHNITADGNAVLHLGDIVYLNNDGGRREELVLKEIVDRLDRIIGSHDQQCSTSQQHPCLPHSISDVSSRAGVTSSQALQKQDHYEFTRPKYQAIKSTSRWQKPSDTSVARRDFFVGTLVLRRQRLHEVAKYSKGLPTTQHCLLSARFVPKPWFSRRMIQLHFEWSVVQDRLFRPSFSPSFADVVPDNHPIILCAANGDTPGLRALLSLKNGPGPSCTTLAGWTPLHFAAAAGHNQTCQLLLQCGAQSDAVGDSNINSLHVAAHFGHTPVFRTLLNAGVDLSDVHDHGQNPFFELLMHRKLLKPHDFHDLVHWLIRGQEEHLVDTESSDIEGKSVLYHLLLAFDDVSNPFMDEFMTAAYLQDFHSLISGGADLNARDVYGGSLLFLACALRRFDIIHALLDHGCDIEIRDDDDYTPLHRAVQRGDYELVSLLIARGANPEAIARPVRDLPPHHYALQWTTSLPLAVVNDDMKMFEILWTTIGQAGDSAIEDDEHNASLLFLASHHRHLELFKRLVQNINSEACLSLGLRRVFTSEAIRILIRAGALPNGTSYESATVEDNTFRCPVTPPLVVAARFNFLDVAEVLLELGADVNIMDSDGMSALYYATQNHHEAMVDLLLSYGADNNVHKTLGLSSAQLSLSSEHNLPTVRLSKLSQLSVDIPDEEAPHRPEMSLCDACRCNDTDLAKKSIAAGASLDDPLEFEGIHRAPLSWALIYGSSDVAELLCWRKSASIPVPWRTTQRKADCTTP